MADASNPHTKYDWAGEQGDRWLGNVDRFEAMLAPVGAALLKRAAYQPGERVLDLGCGGGASTRSIAGSVMPGGGVLGLDISPQLIHHAMTQSSGVDHIHYSCADAASFRLSGEPFDRLHSRFG
ncbi:MAG: methyltransferase domain-containing protein, partial [Pseudomonadota bacterium]